ncbi:hypothetical protein P3W45_001726 [Vairimorpha bombi]|jgi:monothiol glutaredoxin
MEYVKEKNIFYEIDYCNKVLFFENELNTDLDTKEMLKVNLNNKDLKKAIFETYNLKELPSLLYYKKIIKPCPEEIDKIEKIKVEVLQDEILRIIDSGKIVLFMKGEVNYPYCQFSKKVIQILKNHGVDLSKIIYYDVLMNNEIREMVKKVNEWPTFPQLFIDGEFIGGCDVLKTMEGTDELRDLLKDSN